ELDALGAQGVPERLRHRGRLRTRLGERCVGHVRQVDHTPVSTTAVCSLITPPVPVTNATSWRDSWRSPARPCTWRTPSITCDVPPLSPVWPMPNWPPCVLHGKSPRYDRSWSFTNAIPSPGAQNPESSIVSSAVMV